MIGTGLKNTRASSKELALAKPGKTWTSMITKKYDSQKKKNLWVCIVKQQLVHARMTELKKLSTGSITSAL